MGVKKLFKLLKKNAPNSIKEKFIEDYYGKKVAVDVYQVLYQFMIAIKSKDSNKKYFINNNGQDNSHLHIIFYKTISYLKNGILPVYVFDGKPPDIKNKVCKSL